MHSRMLILLLLDGMFYLHLLVSPFVLDYGLIAVFCFLVFYLDDLSIDDSEILKSLLLIYCCLFLPLNVLVFA